MAKKLYIGGLSYDTTQQALQDLFSQAGKVESAAVVADRMTGRSRGFGFVEMSSEEEAQKAISMFNGTEVDGRNIMVNEARPQESRPNRGGGFGGGFSRGGGGGRGGFDRNRQNRW